MGGRGLLVRHGNSLTRTLLSVFPDHPWDISKFAKKPQNYWNSKENQMKALREIEIRLEIKEGDRDAWYNVTNEQIVKAKGTSLLLKHNSSLSQLLSSIYSDHAWDVDRFYNRRRNYWLDPQKKREALIEIGRKLGIKDGDLSGWYKFGNSDITRNGGTSLLKLYENSISGLLKAVFPEHDWDLSKFSRRPKEYWANPATQKETIIAIGKKLGIKEGDYDRWYSVTIQEISRNGGKTLLNQYGGSASRLIMAIFPEHEWLPWRFPAAKTSVHQKKENLRTLITYLEKKLRITSPECWLRVSKEQLAELQVTQILKENGGLKSILKRLQPEVSWDEVLTTDSVS